MRGFENTETQRTRRTPVARKLCALCASVFQIMETDRMKALDEAQLEIAVCDWLKVEPKGWEYVYGHEINESILEQIEVP